MLCASQVLFIAPEVGCEGKHCSPVELVRMLISPCTYCGSSGKGVPLVGITFTVAAFGTPHPSTILEKTGPTLSSTLSSSESNPYQARVFLSVPAPAEI